MWLSAKYLLLPQLAGGGRAKRRRGLSQSVSFPTGSCFATAPSPSKLWEDHLDRQAPHLHRAGLATRSVAHSSPDLPLQPKLFGLCYQRFAEIWRD